MITMATASVSVRFEDRFERVYHRNIKKKVVRCFPVCCENGHVARGFCGKTLDVQVNCESQELPPGTVQIWGKFEPVGLDNQLRPGMRMKAQDFQDKEWLQGVHIRDKSWSLNNDFSNYTYKWQSTKRTSNSFHVFRVYVVLETEQNLIFLGHGASPQFQLSSGNCNNNKKKDLELRLDGKNLIGTFSTSLAGGKRKIEILVSQPRKKRGLGSTFLEMFGLGGENIEAPVMDTKLIRATELEMEENLTIDRMLMMIYHCSSGSFSMGSMYGMLDGSDLLGLILDADDERVEQGRDMSHFKKIVGLSTREADALVESIDYLSDVLIDISKDNEAIKGIIHKFCSRDGFNEFQTLCSLEEGETFEWSPKRELESFRREKSVEVSLFAEYRDQMRRLMQHALNVTGQNITKFTKPMDLAARHGIIAPDPFYPPTKTAGAYVQLQVHGRSLANYDPSMYGNSLNREFENEMQQKRWAKDLFLVKRRIYREIVKDRIVAEIKFKEDDSSSSCLLKAQHNAIMSGLWVAQDCVASDTDKYRDMSDVLTILSGSKANGFLGRLFYLSMSKLEVSITSEKFVALGRWMMFVRPQLSLTFETLAHFKAPIPISFGGSGFFQSEKEVVVFRGRQENDVIFLVMASSLSHINIDSLQAILAREDRAKTIYGEILTFLSSQQQQQHQNKQGNQEPAYHMVQKRIEISPNGQCATIFDTHFLFASKSTAPGMTSFVELETLFTNDQAFHLSRTFRTDYTKSYLDPSDTMLDIL